MTNSLHRSVVTGEGLPQSSQGITEADVLITEVLASRPARPPNFAAENQALCTLAQHLTDNPQSLLKTLVRLALDLCQADTVGVSFLETAPDGTSFFRWVAIAGVLEAFEQGTAPGNFSPCGTTLACNQPQLYSYPERFFTYLAHPQFPVVEGLLLPLQVNDRPLGTLWIISHTDARHFDAEDQRLMISLGGFTASALYSMQQLQQTAAMALSQSEQFNQQILESSDDCIKVLDLEGGILLMSPAGQALLGIQDITPFLNTSWAEFWQGADRQVAIEAINQARAGEVGTFQGYRPALSGEPKWWDSKVSPIRGAEGQIERLLCISRDITERRLAEAALRVSEAKYRTLFSSMDEGYFLADVIFDENDQPIDIFYLDANPAAIRMVGQDYTERRLSEIDPNYESYWYEIFGRVARTGKGERLEQYAEPNKRWYDFYVFKVSDEDSRRVAVVFQDITDRKRREANAAFLIGITEEFSRLSTAAEIMQVVGAKIGAYLKITTCNFIDVNEAQGEVTAHYGWNSTDVPSTVGTFRITEYLSEEFERASRAGETVVIRDTQTDPRTNGPGYAALNMYAFVTVPFHRNGRWTHCIAVCDSRPRDWRDDEIQLIQEISNCIFPHLERIRTEVALRESEAKYRSLFESMDEGFCILQLIFDEQQPTDYRFIEINPAFEPQTGIKNALGRTIRELVPDIEPFWVDLYGTVALTGEPMRFVDCSQVMGRWFDINAFRIGEPHERKVALLFNDISDRKQAELERERLLEAEQQARASAEAARSEAQTANRVKDEFLAVLSHELRSPLNPILGWSKLLQNGKLDAARTQQALKTIERNAQLQSELIEDLLDVSRILQGKLSLNVSSINPVSIIRAAMETMRLAAEAKSITVEASLEADVGLVSGDSTRLQQVLWNLLSNAVKFTPEGGQVNIRLERLDSSAQITISDTGQGIAPDFLPYVFDYFRQADATTIRKFGGLGLGLAIVRHLVELHGGTVGVASPGVGMGATFTVRLPLMPLQAIANQNNQSSEPFSTLNGTQVLVVDDEPDSREFVAFVLEQAGATVLTATTADEALTLLVRSKPSVLLSDIGMPNRDGYMLLQQVRALSPEQGGQIPAIALTAYAGDFNQQQALAAGFQKHISKPVEPEKLIQVISSLIKSA